MLTGRVIARLFVAVWPPDHVAEALAGLHRKDQRGVRFVPPENWHVTLRFLGDADPAVAAAALDDATLRRCTARLGPAVDVLGEHSLVVPVDGVDPLATEVMARTRDLGQRPPRRFAGHITVARVKKRAAMPRALGELVATSFRVDEVALVQSRLHPDGARYETIATWPTT